MRSPLGCKPPVPPGGMRGWGGGGAGFCQRVAAELVMEQRVWEREPGKSERREGGFGEGKVAPARVVFLGSSREKFDYGEVGDGEDGRSRG